jgi:hypothetical protein
MIMIHESIITILTLPFAFKVTIVLKFVLMFKHLQDLEFWFSLVLISLDFRLGSTEEPIIYYYNVHAFLFLNPIANNGLQGFKLTMLLL